MVRVVRGTEVRELRNRGGRDLVKSRKGGRNENEWEVLKTALDRGKFIRLQITQDIVN